MKLDAAPGPGIASEKRKRLLDRSKQRRTIIRLKFESRAASRCRIERFDRVVQTPSGPNYGYGAVLQAVNLIQSTRLVPRGHQEHIRARLDFVREDVIIS